jgi:hypothetical protein
MLDFDALLARAKELEQKIEQSATAHNILLGGLMEVRNLMNIVTPVVEAVIPESKPVIDAVSSVSDGVASVIKTVADAYAREGVSTPQSNE